MSIYIIAGGNQQPEFQRKRQTSHRTTVSYYIVSNTHRHTVDGLQLMIKMSKGHCLHETKIKNYFLLDMTNMQLFFFIHNLID